MPILEIHLLKGRTIEKKRMLTSELTKTICRCLEVRPEQVRIIIDEMEHSDFAIAGELISDSSTVKKDQ